MTNQEHAEMLAKFFTTLFPADQHVHIVPMLAGGKDRFMQNIDEVDEYVAGKQVKYKKMISGYSDPDATPVINWMPRNATSLFARKASSKRATLIPKLYELSNIGYDMYFCVNPLIRNYRRKETVKHISHILLECDDKSISIDEQFKILMKYKESIAAITYSGNKSLHAIIQLRPVMKNPLSVWNYNYLSKKKSRKAPVIPEYEKAVKYWYDTLAKDGLPLDPKTAPNIVQLSRLPGFPHGKTGVISKILYLNSNAKYRWGEQAEYGTWDDFQLDYKNNLNESYEISETSYSDSDIIYSNWEDDFSFDRSDDLIGYNSTKIDHDVVSINSNSIILDNQDSYILSNTSNKGASGVKAFKEKKEVKDKITTTNVRTFCEFEGEAEGDLGSFLDDLAIYYDLKKNGITKRDIRRGMHIVIYRVGALLGLSEKQLIEDWEAIISINPNNIGPSISVALQDFSNCFASLNKIKSYYLPDCTFLPELDDARNKAFKKKLKDEGCPSPTGVCNIVKNVLWGAVKSLPHQCLDGTLGLSSRNLQQASKRYKEPLEWLMQKNIVIMTNPNYCSGKLTRKYKINIPLLLYWLGFKNADLVWDKAVAESQPVKMVA